MTRQQPPRIATWILKHFGCGPDIDVLLGDLAEQYLKGSAIWYWRQALKAIPVGIFREIRAHKGIAASALLIGWGVWILSLMWFFPFVSQYFLPTRMFPKPYPVGPFESPNFVAKGVGVAINLSDPIGSAWSLLIMPVGTLFDMAGLGALYRFGFSVALPLVVAAICGWLVARFHRPQQKAVVLLFAGSILAMDLLLFGNFVLTLGPRPAYVLLGPLTAYVAASVGGILFGGALLHDHSRTASDWRNAPAKRAR
jgi:hypothetical protein